MTRIQDLLSSSDDELQYDPAERYQQQQQQQQRQPSDTRLPSFSALMQSSTPLESNSTAHQGTYLSLASGQAPSPPGQQEHAQYTSRYLQASSSSQSWNQPSDARGPPFETDSLDDEASVTIQLLPSALVESERQESDISATVGKSSRYLREMDRLAILARLDRGEKQAALAKEYHVGRSSICNLLKHRDEVLARVNEQQNPFTRHPKKPRSTTIAPGSDRATEALVASVLASYTPFVYSSSGGGVYIVSSRSTPVLLATLDKHSLNTHEFQRSATQLMMQLVQEALVVVPALSVHTMAASWASDPAAPLSLCAVTMEQYNQHALLDVFYAVAPQYTRGYTQFEWHQDVKIRMLDDSELIGNQYSILLLLDVAATSPSSVACVLEKLRRLGANVALVVVFVSQAVVEMVRTQFPAVRIVTTEVEGGLVTSQQQQMRSALFKQRLEQLYQLSQTEQSCTLAV